MLTLPPVPLPPVDELDASATEPLLPDVATPDLSVNDPLAPFRFEVVLRIVNVPDVLTARPDEREISPPSLTELMPAVTTTRPDTPESPEATCALIEPALPLCAFADRRTCAPEDPSREFIVLMKTPPLE